MANGFTRRELIGTAAAGAAFSGLFYPRFAAAWAAGAQAGEDLPTTRIRKVYVAKPKPTWPKPTLVHEEEIKRIDGILAEMQKKMPGITFEGSELYKAGETLPDSADALGRPDALLIINITSGAGGVINQLLKLQLPTIMFFPPYSGHAWCGMPDMLKINPRTICLSTSDYAEIASACNLARAMRLLRDTRILHVYDQPFYKPDLLAAFKERFGVSVLCIGTDKMDAAYQSVREEDARKEAAVFIRGAQKVVEPSAEEIVKSFRLYLAMRKMLADEKAQAITIPCLGLFAENKLPAYPCLGFSRLNDVGLTGVCEGDVLSTITQLMFTYAFGVPGFVSDPVIDTSRNEVIHAHCVSATRMDGPDGPQAPYTIRSHMEDNKGASLQVRMRVGQVITCAKMIDPETMLISTGTITDNPDVDRGCRTKITTQVADARKLLNNYIGGLHRVVCYGNRLQEIKHLGTLMGFKVVEEC